MNKLMRTNIAALSPYRCARDEFEGEAEVYLDANESWREYCGQKNINRYPDPRNTMLRKAVEEVLHLPFKNTVIGNGSDEIIDLLFRIFCYPKEDKVLLMPPTYGAYSVFAAINDVKIISVPLKIDFSMDTDEVIKTIKEQSPKLLFICSPNNPTSNVQGLDEIERILKANKAITVVDEAYFEFAKTKSAVTLLDKYPNLVVLRTLSKCWALAGARIGIGVMNETLQKKMIDVKYPYNIPTPSADIALKALSNYEEVFKECENTIKERERLRKALELLEGITTIYPSQANFLLCKVLEADKVYKYLQEKQIIVRNRSREYNCENCLRITVGSVEENNKLLRALEEYVWE